MESSAADALSPPGSSVAVQFFTKSTYPEATMPETTFSVPVLALPQGLNELVNQVLELKPAIPFDFLINDQYITVTLERFMRRKGLTPEQLLMIEYKPALQAEESSKLPHDDWVASVVAPLPCVGAVLLTGSYDHCVRLWQGDECVAVGTGHTEAVKAVALHRPSLVAAAAAPGAGLRATGKRKRAADSGLQQVPQQFKCASVSKDGTIKTWHFESRKFTLLGSTTQHIDAIDSVDIDPSGEWLATGSWDTLVKVFRWDDLAGPSAATAAPLVAFADHARSVLKVRFSTAFATNALLYSTGLDGCVKLWNVTSQQLVTTLAGSHAALSMATRPGDSSELILTGHTDNRLRLFDARAKTGAVHSWSGHRQWVHGVSWLWRADESGDAPVASPHRLASASEDATVRIWDMRSTAAALLTLDKLHADGVLDVTYVGANEIATCGKDNRAKTLKLDDAGAHSQH